MRALIRVTGAVQGVGYRPFVAELANKYELSGEVKNLGGIVEIIAEGDEEKISSFVDELKISSPSGSIVLKVSLDYLESNEPESLSGHSGFCIASSGGEFDKDYLPVFLPDIGICPECMKELLSKNDRRYRYPLISCASCGPRFSILKQLPYDRETTTMDVFLMCPECASEYGRGRRRHAQTISCHACGPQITYLNCSGKSEMSDEERLRGDKAIAECVRVLENGGIIGLKGVGGYQLLASPYNKEAVKRLREIKGRETKPFAVMFDAVSDIEKICMISDMEKHYIESAARPIVLVDKSEDPFADNVCGNSRQIGAFLPSTGVHKLITMELKELIVTSGNISGEPMLISDDVFRDRFADKIDGILYNDREILRPIDDSVLQIITNCNKKEVTRFIRRARGYVPLPVFLEKPLRRNVIYEAFGADLKNSFSIGFGDRIIQSQFLGDMEDYSVLKLQEKELSDFEDIFRIDNLNADKILIISDMHPGYHTSELAKQQKTKMEKTLLGSGSTCEFLQIQHHHAHIGSVMAENGLYECIGVAFDGTGFGTDNTIWGSEFLICKGGAFERIAHLKPVKIVGQDEAMRNAKISAACYLIDAGLDLPEGVLNESEATLLNSALQNNINAYPNSGMGRLFDAVSCLLGICDYNSYEGECAIKLQNAAEEYLENTSDYSFFDKSSEDYNGEYLEERILSDLIKIREDDGNYIPELKGMIRFIIGHYGDIDKGRLSYGFHYALAEITKEICVKIRERCGLTEVCLSGGVFTNRLLLTLCERLLVKEGFVVYYNRVFPTNDQGISVGQIYLADLQQ